MEIVNNKELIPLEHYLEEYQKADPTAISERCGAVWDEGQAQFLVSFLGREHAISWPDFTITVPDDGIYSPLSDSNQAKIFVLRYLLEGKQVPSTGKFVTYRDVPWGEVYYRQFNGRCMKRLEFGYGTSPEKLGSFRTRMERLGANTISGADAAYEYEILPGYQTRFLLWLGDDEFPPSSQILFSDNFAVAFHAEDLVVVAEIMIGALKKV